MSLGSYTQQRLMKRAYARKPITAMLHEMINSSRIVGGQDSNDRLFETCTLLSIPIIEEFTGRFPVDDDVFQDYCEVVCTTLRSFLGNRTQGTFDTAVREALQRYVQTDQPCNTTPIRIHPRPFVTVSREPTLPELLPSFQTNVPPRG